MLAGRAHASAAIRRQTYCLGVDAAKGFQASATGWVAPRAVITPGTLRDRKAFVLGKWRSAALARAAFNLFLGDFPVDAAAKVQAAQAIVYVTNGFKCALGPAALEAGLAALARLPAERDAGACVCRTCVGRGCAAGTTQIPVHLP